MLFASEDCSSAVGKATGILGDDLLGVYTGSIKSAYTNSENVYGYKPVTSSDGEKINLEKITAGDIYVRGNHTAIITGGIDNYGKVQVFEFNRDIDLEKNKFLGGGMGKYDLLQKEKPIYILRAEKNDLKESAELSDVLKIIDSNYNEAFNHKPLDVVGDCGVFIAEGVEEI